jgi:DNA replication and repair protein RecF
LKILDLRAENFRNLGRVELEFSARVNVLVGRNGQGKTNLLEALYLTGGFRSFRGARTRDLIRNGAHEARLAATVEADDVTRHLDVSFKAGGKAYRVDGKAPGSLSEWVGRLVMVTFSPDDLFLVKGEPELRRRWLDRVIFLLEPDHLRAVMVYQKALKSRNALLKDGMFGRDLMLLDAYDASIAKAGAAVRRGRRHWLKRLSELVSEEMRSMTGDLHTATLEDETEVESENEAEYLQNLMRRREDDVRRKLTTWGVHHDDAGVVFAGKDARHFASQGEQRALTLGMKLAETRLLREVRHVEPVLLLDDVAGELDEQRHRALFSRLLMSQLGGYGGQVFVAGTDAPRGIEAGAAEVRFFQVHSGEIRQ